MLPPKILTIIGLFLLLGWEAQAGWLCGWDCRRPYTITENSGDILSNYQVRVDVTHSTGMNSDFSDLRFTSDDGETLLDYWIETYTTSDAAVVWVEVPSIPASGTTDIYMYHCNSSATDASNATNTFIFFDDMNNLTGWNAYGNNNSIAIDNTTFPGTTGLLKQNNCDPSGGWKNIGTTVNSFRLITREGREDASGSCQWNRYGMEYHSGNGPNSDGYTIRRFAGTNGTAGFGYEQRNNGSASSASTNNFSQPSGSLYRTELRRCDDTDFIGAYLYEDDRTAIGSVTGTFNSYDQFNRVTVRGGRPYIVDFMAVADFVCNEPTLAAGSVEEVDDDYSIAISESSGNTDDDGLICHGDAATLTAPAGFSGYNWSSGGTSASTNVTGGGNYTVTLTDADGCTLSLSTSIQENPAISAGTCNKMDDPCQMDIGAVTLQAAGGTAPYTIIWTPYNANPSSTTINSSGGQATLSNIPGGSTISFTVEDSNGCLAE